MKTRTSILTAMLLLALAGQTLAATTWTLTSASTSVVPGAYVTSSGGVSVTATGWANTGDLSSQNGGGTTPLQQQLATGNFVSYPGGLGINNLDGCSSASGTCDLDDIANSQPEHAIDNEQRNEMVLLSFSQLTKLTSVNFGWVGSDADYSVFAYTGSGTPSLGGLTWSALLSNGWSTIGSYANSTTGDHAIVPTTVAAQNVYSSYWLVGAYNPLADTKTQASGLGTGGDYLKLASVKGDLCVGGTGVHCSTTTNNSVSEPGSLALFGAALFGMLGLRRRAGSARASG